MKNDPTINVPKNNTLEITVSVGMDNIDSYTATLTVKETVASSVKFTVESSNITDSVITITVPHEKNDIEAKGYVYGIDITDGTNNYTLDLVGGNIPQTIGNYNVLPVV